MLKKIDRISKFLKDQYIASFQIVKTNKEKYFLFLKYNIEDLKVDQFAKINLVQTFKFVVDREFRKIQESVVIVQARDIYTRDDAHISISSFQSDKLEAVLENSEEKYNFFYDELKKFEQIIEILNIQNIDRLEFERRKNGKHESEAKLFIVNDIRIKYIKSNVEGLSDKFRVENFKDEEKMEQIKSILLK